MTLDRFTHDKIDRDADATRTNDRRAAAGREVAAYRLVEEAATICKVLLFGIDEIGDAIDSPLADPGQIEIIRLASAFHRCSLVHYAHFGVGEKGY